MRRLRRFPWVLVRSAAVLFLGVNYGGLSHGKKNFRKRGLVAISGQGAARWRKTSPFRKYRRFCAHASFCVSCCVHCCVATICHYLPLFTTICHYLRRHYLPLFTTICHYLRRHYLPLFTTICHYLRRHHDIIRTGVNTKTFITRALSRFRRS